MTWADPNVKWDGFRFKAYWLNSEKVLGLSLFEERRVDGKLEKVPTTVGEIFGRYTDRCDGVEDATFAAEVTSGTEKTKFAGTPFNHRLLGDLLALRKEGANPFLAKWFFYNHDICTDDPHEIYNFFVVCNDKIVRAAITGTADLTLQFFRQTMTLTRYG